MELEGLYTQSVPRSRQPPALRHSREAVERARVAGAILQRAHNYQSTASGDPPPPPPPPLLTPPLSVRVCGGGGGK